MTTHETLIELYESLLEAFGPQHWWPGETPFEIAVGAILTQNTNWTNVEKALDRIKARDLLACDSLLGLPDEELAELIRPAGYFRLKTGRLKNFLAWLDQRGGCLEALEDSSVDSLREELLAVKGIGPETADSILLYALDLPTFVVDTYTARLAVRHGLIEPPFDYHELQELFTSNLPCDAALYNEYHALIVAVGKDFCKPKARCELCPLQHHPHSLAESS